MSLFLNQKLLKNIEITLGENNISTVSLAHLSIENKTK